MAEASPFPAVIEGLRRHPRLGSQIVHVAVLPGQDAAYGEVEPPFPERLREALARGGAERLWSHQADGLQAVRAGENVLVTTPTASGKSLVFQLPVLEEAARGGPGRALFLYPLKALGQDQRNKLEDLARAAGIDAPCAIYDGDTPAAERQRLRRQPPRVLVTNPDMLHLGILPSWLAWAPFLSELQWVVLDELHTYRGIFGSHFHHVLQRLLRLARALGAEPRLIASSATAGNAEEFAKALTGMTFRRVADSGAPREARSLVLVQPSASPYTTALQLLVELLRQGLKTIVFTKARRITELLYSWLRKQEPELARRVASYRSGFLPEERRRIEADLFSGALQGVISTSALEMGIDVGGLDACILVGWPGSVMATWQRSGRVGRQGRESLTALVALPDALDQWLVRHPEELLARPCEPLVVDPGNAPVARQHLPCAAAEEPLDRATDDAYLRPHAGAVERLLEGHQLRASADGRHLYARARRPHRAVSLRGGGETVAIVEAARSRTIGTVDGVRVLRECHPGAVYLHGGRQYVVRELDLGTARALVEPAAVDWYTNALTEKDTRVLAVLAERHDGPLSAWLGRVEVTERVVGYERKKIFGAEVLSQHPLELPAVTFETVAFWWAAKPAQAEALREGGRHVLGALHAAEHTSIALLPLLALCDRGDIGGISMPFHPQVGCGVVFVYDGHPGGVGIADRGFAELPELLRRVASLLDECPCEEGCPSCVQSPKCGNGNRPLDKLGARRVLAMLLGEEAVAGAEAPWPSPELGEEEDVGRDRENGPEDGPEDQVEVGVGALGAAAQQLGTAAPVAATGVANGAGSPMTRGEPDLDWSPAKGSEAGAEGGAETGLGTGPGDQAKGRPGLPGAVAHRLGPAAPAVANRTTNGSSSPGSPGMPPLHWNPALDSAAGPEAGRGPGPGDQVKGGPGLVGAAAHQRGHAAPAAANGTTKGASSPGAPGQPPLYWNPAPGSGAGPEAGRGPGDQVKAGPGLVGVAAHQRGPTAPPAANGTTKGSSSPGAPGQPPLHWNPAPALISPPVPLPVSNRGPVPLPVPSPAPSQTSTPFRVAVLRRLWQALTTRSLAPLRNGAPRLRLPPGWLPPQSFTGPRTVLFDLETRRSAADVGGWGNAHRMGVSLAVLCHLEEGRFEVYPEDQVAALAEALRAADLVIGYNVRRFDYRVLAGYTGADYNRLVPTLDLLEEVHRALGFRLRLDDLARETLGSGKSADGLQCLEWVRDGRLDLVEAYCRRDVEVLRDLYLFGRREGYVLYRDRHERRVRLPVTW